MTVPVGPITATHPLFADAAELFDEYRQHYGANPAPEAVADWLRDQLISSRARLYVAAGDRAQGICSVTVVPAALTLRTAWLVRDLYVAPHWRRYGVARALLGHVADDARAAGAHRLSVQTETANTAATDLYARSGFTSVTGVSLMDRTL